MCVHTSQGVSINHGRGWTSDRPLGALRRRLDSGAVGPSVTSPPPEPLDNSQALVVFNHLTNRPHDSYYSTLRLYYLLPYLALLPMKINAVAFFVYFCNEPFVTAIKITNFYLKYSTFIEVITCRILVIASALISESCYFSIFSTR